MEGPGQYVQIRIEIQNQQIPPAEEACRQTDRSVTSREQGGGGDTDNNNSKSTSTGGRHHPLQLAIENLPLLLPALQRRTEEDRLGYANATAAAAPPGPKTYACKQCLKTFSLKCNLKAHQRIHSGERPYRCAHCDKRFNVATNLRAHQRIHSGEKPFNCPQCDKRFAVSCNLKAHRRIHTGEKPYRCEECGKGFNQSSPLQAHQRIHAREKSLPLSTGDGGGTTAV